MVRPTLHLRRRSAEPEASNQTPDAGAPDRTMRAKTSLGVVLVVVACLGAAGVVAREPHPSVNAATAATATPPPSQANPRLAGAAPLPLTAVPDFSGAPASDEVRQVARWVLAHGDAAGRHLVLVDKRQARIFVLDPRGRLRGTAPVLLGLARGDQTVPGIGDRPLAQVRPEERTTPAGRFVPEPGINLQGEDIVWLDYDAAVSMHRVRAKVKSERRLERLASPTPADNRISYGCINLPAAFYEQVLVPAVRASAMVYVLPEVRPLAEVFGPGLQPPGAQAAGKAAVRQADGVRQQVLAPADEVPSLRF